MTKSFKSFLSVVALLLLFFALNSSEGLFGQTAFGQFESHKKPLRVVVVAQPLTYQQLRGLQGGYEYDILQQFAKDYDYQLSLHIVQHESDVLAEVAAGHADIGAARLPTLWVAHTALIGGPVYDEQKISLICRRDVHLNFSLMGRLELNKATRFVTTSKTVSRDWVENFEKETPMAHVQVLPQPRPTVLFRQLLRGRSDCLLLDRLQAEYDLRSYPELRLVRDLRSYQQYQFAISPQKEELIQNLRHWFPRAAYSGTLRQIKDRYKNYLDELTPIEQAEFTRFFGPRFQPFAKYFKRYSFRNHIPWQLAAAVAYQESHLNPDARSWTGVKGLMQLTQETAEHVGIEDRTDPEQSILGGAKYLHILLERQPKNLPDRERLALALATYNVGPAHMWDAQNLAVRLGKDPHSWKDIRSVLPKLGKPYYAQMLRYGPARGDEPVEFVDRVLSYLDLILIASSSPTPRPVFITQR